MTKPRTYVREYSHAVRIGNGLIELDFDPRHNGALTGIRDRQSRWQFIRDPLAPKTLYRLELRRKGTPIWVDSRDARRFRWRQVRAEGGATLLLETTDFPGRALKVTVSVTVERGNALSRWRMRVTGVARGETVGHLDCPLLSGILRVGEGVPGEVVATPRQSEGYLFRDPYPVVDNLPLMAGKGPDQPATGVGQFWQCYPGSQSMQFMLYYNRHAGLYLACHDNAMNVKSFACGPVADWGAFPALTIGHYPPVAEGRDAIFEYDTILGVFHGDWYDGADVYKTWARQQWWCAKKLGERDIADWLRRGFGVWQMSNYHIPKLKLNHSLDQIATEVNGLARDIGVPLAALIFNFEKGGAWTGPKGFFPPREGNKAFRAAMQKLHKAGNHGFIYMPGGNWYVAIDSYDPPFDSRAAFEVEGRPNGIVNEQGVVPVANWYAGWHGARLCPATAFTKALTSDLLLGALRRGCAMVQIDNFPCCGPEACYSDRHGHPAGHGPWYTQAWMDILADVRRRAKALNPDCVITTEGIAETYIPFLDLYDQRAGNMEYFGHFSDSDPMHGEPIPLFGYVYSGYIGAYLAAYPECNRPEVLYWTRALGKALAQGVIPSGGRYWPEPGKSNPVTLAFYKKVVRAAAQECWRYIMFGEMLRPPAIEVPLIEASYLRFTGECLDHLLPQNRHVVTDHAVQHSAWRAADGTIGYILANISLAPVEVSIRLATYDESSPHGDADIIHDGRRKPLFRQRRLPRQQKIQMPPLSVTVIEITPRC